MEQGFILRRCSAVSQLDAEPIGYWTSATGCKTLPTPVEHPPFAGAPDRMSRPSYALIDTQAFVANYRYAKSLAPDARALAVIKANAYGHGAVVLGRILAPEADAFGVASSEEAMELRESGIDNPILLLRRRIRTGRGRRCGPAQFHAGAAFTYPARMAACGQTHTAAATSGSRSTPACIDSVSRRSSCPGFMRACAPVQTCGEIVLMSHFACADETAQPGHRTPAGIVRAGKPGNRGQGQSRQFRRDPRLARRRTATGSGPASCSTAARRWKRATRPALRSGR